MTEAARKHPVVTVTGPRQSGKTTLCRMAFGDRPYVSLEDPDERRFAADDPRGFLAQFPDGAVLDEIQRTPELPSYLQGDVDARTQPGRWILTGSSDLRLVGTASQSLAGRTAVLTLLPFDADERAMARRPTSLFDAILGGGYPAIHDRGLEPHEWLSGYVRTYVERDVRSVLQVGDLIAFQTFLELCAGLTAQLVNWSALGAAAGVSHNTARSWGSVLEAGYLSWRVPPFHRNIKKRLVKTPKLHLVDTGLACHLLGIRTTEHLRTHPLRGPLFESWVASEIRKAWTNAGLEPRMSHYRTHRGDELDLVLDRGADLVAVEAKSGQTISGDFFGELERFARASETPVRRVLVYGGDARQSRTAGEALPWREIHGFDWTA